MKAKNLFVKNSISRKIQSVENQVSGYVKLL
jgi:hypothetical protein